ncbi:DUF4890 domain-containing protein [Hymenobacter sp. BT770]|uniref:DUF4890 domain-containing protein n=1 Tax=Hymenobacter sp. BT770 TaxID=2886942 RepID=UPI001D12B43A|nr:DUF4890 domain-containing protein [Hymenobacter sp. BT770]MCC3155252.1 DUF4890 domain-containing protein [Hymenobacter sp. BT770]MDO3417283.1 DUF4890 domain-containing protein [Hymenobacter sp. BT770]
MKTSFLPLLAAFALTIGTAAAQTTPTTPPAPGQMEGRGYGRMQGTPEEMATRQSQRMTQELGLSADQTAKVQQILLARGQEMQAMRGQARDESNREQMRTQMEASRTKYEEQFKAVLTPEQYTKYTTMQGDRMNRGGGGGRGYGQADGTEAGKVKMKADKVKIKASKADKKAAKAAKKASM